MPAASQKPVIATIVIATLVLLAGLYMTANSVKDSIPEVPEIDVPTAAEIAAEVPVPDITGVQEQIADIHNKLDADEVEISDRLERDAIRYAESEIDSDDFKEMIADLVGIDEDYLVIDDLDVKDVEVTAETDDDAEDGNVCVEGFLRIRYYDSDDPDEDEVIYVVTTAQITDLYDEENDQDVVYSIREVSRDFEFE